MRLIKASLGILVILAVLVSCAGNAKDYDVGVVYDEMAGSGNTPEMLELSVTEVISKYGLEASGIAAFAGGEAKNTEADEIALFKADSNEAAKSIGDKLAAYLANKGENVKNYQPDEYSKVSGAVVEVNGLYAALIITDNAASLASKLGMKGTTLK